MAKEYTTKDGKKIVGWYRRGGKAIPIIEGQERKDASQPKSEAKKGEGHAIGRTNVPKWKKGKVSIDDYTGDGDSWFLPSRRKTYKADKAFRDKEGRVHLHDDGKVKVFSKEHEASEYIPKVGDWKKKSPAKKKTPNTEKTSDKPNKKDDPDYVGADGVRYKTKRAARQVAKNWDNKRFEDEVKKNNGGKVKVTVGDYSGDGDSWQSSARTKVHEVDGAYVDKDKRVHLYNNGKWESLPEHHRLEGQYSNSHINWGGERGTDKVGEYIMPNAKKKATQSNEQFIKDYYDTMMKAGKTADKVRKWGNDASWNSAIAENDDDRKKWQDYSNATEDLARFIEGREPVARIAKRLLKTANEHSEEVKRDIQDSLAGDWGSINKGVPYMIKGQGSMHRKLREKAAQKGLQPEQYAEKVTDALRFTDMVDGDHYVESFNRLKKGLEDRGYEMVEAENTIHKKGEKYRGLNTLVESPKGYTFELQFHTPQSFDIKEENHKDYEVERRLTTSAEDKDRLGKTMIERANKIQTPKGAESIQDIPRHKRKGPSDSAIRNVMKERGMTRTEAVMYLRKKNKY